MKGGNITRLCAWLAFDGDGFSGLAPGFLPEFWNIEKRPNSSSKAS